MSGFVVNLEELVRGESLLARDKMIAELIKHWDEIEDLAVERCTTVGVEEYDDASFHKSPGELRDERFAEYADALFYWQVERLLT